MPATKLSLNSFTNFLCLSLSINLSIFKNLLSCLMNILKSFLSFIILTLFLKMRYPFLMSKASIALTILEMTTSLWTVNLRFYLSLALLNTLWNLINFGSNGWSILLLKTSATSVYISLIILLTLPIQTCVFSIKLYSYFIFLSIILAYYLLNYS